MILSLYHRENFLSIVIHWDQYGRWVFECYGEFIEGQTFCHERENITERGSRH